MSEIFDVILSFMIGICLLFGIIFAIISGKIFETTLIICIVTIILLGISMLKNMVDFINGVSSIKPGRYILLIIEGILLIVINGYFQGV